MNGLVAELAGLGHALRRATAVLTVIDREHAQRDLYTAIRGALHEIETAQRILDGRPAEPPAPPPPGGQQRG